MFLAKALYDNIAESPDELPFRRGDVITVTELDTGGLDGWWLCSLRGKQGIAPGNRLKILSGMSDYSFGDESSYSSNENLSTRKSWDHSFEKGLSITGSPGNEIYDEPNRSFQDYDVPPSRYFPKEHKSTNANGTAVSRKSLEDSILEKSCYDSPQNSSMGNFNVQTYDVPQQQVKLSPDGLSSNRSSVLSNTSLESPLPSGRVSVASSQRSSSVPSVCDSARSSLDVSSQELYDTPSRSSHTNKQLSADSGLDIYDTPPKSKSVHCPVGEDYDFPRRDQVDSVISIEPTQLLEPTRTRKSLEHSIEDIYDVPKSNAPRLQMKGLNESSNFSHEKPSDNGQCVVYDIPPQVTRDSVISSRSDSSEEGQRLSTCSTDSRGSLSDIPTYDELPIEMDAALELLTKLQQDLQTTVNKFSGFVSSTWRKKESLQTKLYEIKLASTAVKNSLKDFIKFAQGTLANSAKLPDKKLVNKLYKQLNPLQNSYQLISSALKNLDDMKWQIDILAEPLDSAKSDDLGQIAGLCKDLSCHVKKLASLIQGNATLLFSKSHDIEIMNRERKVATDSLAAAKPPIGPKPEIGPKRNKLVQQRPLPAPPTTNRPLPPTPVEDQMNSLRLRYEEKDSQVNESVGREDIYANDTSEWISEYDYVHLESRDIVAQLKVQEDKISDFEKEYSPSESECEHKEGSEKVEDPYEKKLEADLEELDSPPKQEENDTASFDTDGLLEEEVKTPVNTVNADVNSKLLLVRKEEKVTLSLDTVQLDPNDKQVLVYYYGQMETHSTLLTNALDAFFNCVESNEPPKVFISHSKFVIVSAHKLVYIGDTLHRNIMHSSVKNKIMSCANQLCDSLKLSVSATKLAALQYPSVPAVQEMVDSVLAVSKAANDLKVIISQASSL